MTSEKTSSERPAIGKKRKFDEYDVGEVEESKTTIVHSVVTQLSPVRVSKRNTSVRYFDGTLSNGKSNVRVVSFDPTLHTLCESSKATSSPIKILNCNIKPNKNKKEIVLTQRSKIEASPRKFTMNT